MNPDFLIMVVAIAIIAIIIRWSLGLATRRTRRRRNWYNPERLDSEQERRDRELGRNAFYTYVLNTDYGHYVGHTSRPRQRLIEHQSNKVSSTAYGRPMKGWITPKPFRTREESAQFEAALKSLRDQRHRRFKEITGLNPIPFNNPMP